MPLGNFVSDHLITMVLEQALTHYALICVYYSIPLCSPCSHAYYAFEVNILFSNYVVVFFVHRQNISFPTVLKHGRSRNII